MWFKSTDGSFINVNNVSIISRHPQDNKIRVWKVDSNISRDICSDRIYSTGEMLDEVGIKNTLGVD